MKLMFAEIFKNLAVLERQFNEIRYPPETTFLPSFSLRIRRAESECLKKGFPVLEIEDLLKGSKMAYEVAAHPSVRTRLVKLHQRNSLDYDYVKKRLLLLAYKPDMGQPLTDEFRGKWRMHIGPYVLVYVINRRRKILTFLAFEHYTGAYDRFKAYA